MFTLEEIAEKFGLKLNTLRYWLNKNNDDCECGYYEVNLMDLTQRVKIYKKTSNGKDMTRSYLQIMILDFEEFKEEFFKYTEFVKNFKRKKRVGNLAWTEAAIECYCCDMVCENCFNRDICKDISRKDGTPPMKNTVKKLLNTLGKPYIR